MKLSKSLGFVCLALFFFSFFTNIRIYAMDEEDFDVESANLVTEPEQLMQYYHSEEQRLDLSGKQLSWDDILNLLPLISMFEQQHVIITLDLRNNNLVVQESTDVPPVVLIELIQSSIKNVYVQGNNLNDEVIQAVVRGLSKEDGYLRRAAKFALSLVLKLGQDRYDVQGVEDGHESEEGVCYVYFHTDNGKYYCKKISPTLTRQKRFSPLIKSLLIMAITAAITEGFQFLSASDSTTSCDMNMLTLMMQECNIGCNGTWGFL